MSEQPRLLFCCFDVLPGPHGLSRRVTEYLKGLVDRFQVVVLSTKTPDHSHIERYHGARLLRVPVGSGDLQARIQAFDRAVRRQLESEEYVIAHFFDPFGGYALADSRSQYGFRLLYDAQSFPSQELKYTHPSTEADRRFLSKVRRQELFCLMNADAVVCGSEVTRDYVLSLGAPPGSLHVFHQPVDLAPFTRQAVGRPDASPMKLLHLGSQLGYQGLTTLLRAMQLALRQADMRLIVVGPKVPDGQVPLDELVTELKLTGKVEFQPPVPHDDLYKVLASADVGVLTLDESDRNRLQGGPLAKVGEYLAAGRPIIASDLPVVRELVPEHARMLFPAGDFKALADILVKLAGSSALRVGLGEKAREASGRFDASAVRGKLLDLYGVLSTRGKVTPQGEQAADQVTQLRKTGSSTEGTGSARVATRAPGETLDEEPPVVVGQSLEHAERPDDRLRAAVTEPGAATVTTSPAADLGTPIVKGRRKKGKGGTDEHTPIRPPPESQPEPSALAAARSRRVISKPGNKSVAPALTPETTPIAPDADTPPPRVKRTSEGKGVRSPLVPAGPPPNPKVTTSTETPAVTAAIEVPLAAIDPQGLPRIRRTQERTGVSRGTDQVPVLVPNPAAPPRATEQLPVLVPAAAAPAPAVPAPRTEQIPVQAAPLSGLAPPPAFDLPAIKRGPEVKAAHQIPVLVPDARPPVAAPVLPGAQIPPPVLPPMPPPPLPPPPGDAPPPRIKRTSEKGMRSPVAPGADEPEEISSDEIEDVEEADAPPAPRVDVWLAQLLFGYCPPEAIEFERPPPPTTFPGRET